MIGFLAGENMRTVIQNRQNSAVNDNFINVGISVEIMSTVVFRETLKQMIGFFFEKSCRGPNLNQERQPYL